MRCSVLSLGSSRMNVVNLGFLRLASRTYSRNSLAYLQDAVIGGHDDVQKLLAKHGGKAYKALAAKTTAIEAMAEGDRRHAITEILHFASTGDIKRMQVLCKAHGIKVGYTPAERGHIVVDLLTAAGYSIVGIIELHIRHTWLKSTVRQNFYYAAQVSDPSCCDYDKRTPL